MSVYTGIIFSESQCLRKAGNGLAKCLMWLIRIVVSKRSSKRVSCQSPPIMKWAGIRLQPDRLIKVPDSLFVQLSLVRSPPSPAICFGVSLVEADGLGKVFICCFELVDLTISHATVRIVLRIPGP